MLLGGVRLWILHRSPVVYIQHARRELLGRRCPPNQSNRQRRAEIVDYDSFTIRFSEFVLSMELLLVEPKLLYDLWHQGMPRKGIRPHVTNRALMVLNRYIDAGRFVRKL